MEGYQLPRDIWILIIEYLDHIKDITNLELSCKYLKDLTRANVYRISNTFRSAPKILGLLEYSKLKIVDGVINLECVNTKDEEYTREHRRLLLQLTRCNLEANSLGQLVDWIMAKLQGIPMNWFSASYLEESCYRNVMSHYNNFAYSRGTKELRIEKMHIRGDGCNVINLQHSLAWYVRPVIEVVKLKDIETIDLRYECSLNELGIETILDACPQFYRNYQSSTKGSSVILSRHLPTPEVTIRYSTLEAPTMK